MRKSITKNILIIAIGIVLLGYLISVFLNNELIADQLEIDLNLSSSAMTDYMAKHAISPNEAPKDKEIATWMNSCVRQNHEITKDKIDTYKEMIAWAKKRKAMTMDQRKATYQNELNEAVTTCKGQLTSIVTSFKDTNDISGKMKSLGY